MANYLYNYHVIILQHNRRDRNAFTVMVHCHYGYTVKSGSRKQILADANCLWNRTDVNKLVGEVELRSRQVMPILKRYTHVNNLNRCYFVWATNFKAANI